MTDFEEVYFHSIDIVRNLVEDIRFNRELNLDSVLSCADLICQYLGKSKSMNILTLPNHVQNQDPYIYTHPVNVAYISFLIGNWMELRYVELTKLVCAALLHDIGKAKIKDSILSKKDNLTDEERELIKTHPVVGYKLLLGKNILERDILLGILSHHEKQDGSGYPIGLKGKEISYFGRIIAIAELFDHITATNSYHTTCSPFKAVEEIQDRSFRSLDPQICQIFLKNVYNYYYGSIVRLSNEHVGEIIYVNPAEKTKPLIRCENEYHNLTKERDLEIVEILVNK